MILALMFLVQLPISDSCVLTEGLGADFGNIGVSTKDKAEIAPRGVTLEYEGNILVRIFVHGGNCQTSKGIKIGDSQKKIEQLYGKGRKRTEDLKKGQSDSLGKLGDFMLEYPGVAFVISNREVAAIFITGKGHKNKARDPDGNS